MADQNDRHVVGRPDEPGPSRPSGSPGQEPTAGVESSEPEPVSEPAQAAEDQPVAAHHSPPPGPPHGPPYAVPAGSGGPGLRDRVRSRPVQLLAAGIIGAIIGGGAVGLLDVLDDGGHRDGHYLWYGPGRHGGDEFGQWQRRMPDRMPDPRFGGPMMPGGPDGWNPPHGMPQPPSTAPSPATPTP